MECPDVSAEELVAASQAWRGASRKLVLTSQQLLTDSRERDAQARNTVHAVRLRRAVREREHTRGQ